MSLAPGVRLGPYEIGTALGQGGMGEVYKARDTRLDRTVAIKVLSSEIASDRSARERFEREARAVAALNHPHICTLHDIGRHELAGDGSALDFLVMELIEGETLAARLSRGALPVDRALAHGMEIASALDRAHRAGIVHRDIKPANIMVTKAGIKLLDFGLAKLKGIGGPISMSGIEGPRSTAIDTAHGTLLGTVPYMAPEQVEGKDADARSDIWALGAVLYEMVTGKRPFDGETPASVIGAILKDVPAPVSSRQPVAPRALDDVVVGCLAKDPEERWQNAGDVGRLLTKIANSPSTDSESRVRHGASRRERAAWAAVAALLLAALAYVTLWGRPVAPAGEVVRLSVNPPGQTVFTALTSATVPPRSLPCRQTAVRSHSSPDRLRSIPPCGCGRWTTPTLERCPELTMRKSRSGRRTAAGSGSSTARAG